MRRDGVYLTWKYSSKSRYAGLFVLCSIHFPHSTHLWFRVLLRPLTSHPRFGDSTDLLGIRTMRQYTAHFSLQQRGSGPSKMSLAKQVTEHSLGENVKMLALVKVFFSLPFLFCFWFYWGRWVLGAGDIF